MTTSTPVLTKDMQMKDILQAFPSARRALFQKYHVGGCSSCGFQDTDTLAEVCQSHNLDNVQEVIDHILRSHEVDQKMQISAKAAAELLRTDKRVRLVDVRGPEEHQVAHIEGDFLVDSEEKVQEVMSWPKDTPIIMYCHHGMRSMDAASYLIGHGFTNVKSLTGGIDAWSLEVDPKVPRY